MSAVETGSRLPEECARPGSDLVVGTVFSRTIRVTDDLAARHLVGQGVKTFSTPEMIRFMERCVMDGLGPHLPPGHAGVGTHVDIRHLAPTPVGTDVTVTCTLVEIDRRRLTFVVEVRDTVEKIGQGRYECFLVDRARQQKRLEAKLDRERTQGTASPSHEKG
ncbi:MAG TPA: thioesterase family protein [Candidatus Sulfotelmatobacter sp.]|nr:thioesterase family protein [Candidatus Sulfotelmatobacter sp.]